MHNVDAATLSELREQLLGFNKKVLRLEHTRFFRGPYAPFSFSLAKGKITSLSSIVDQADGHTIALELTAELDNFELHHFDRDNIEAAVLTYRMLVQHNDRYSVARLADLYDHVHPVFSKVFSQLRERYRDFFSEDSPLRINGVALSYGTILDTVIYGELAHSNKEKAATFRHWTRWIAHEKALWLVFDHALRNSLEFLRDFRDLNAATLMLYFDVPVSHEVVFTRLQEKGFLRKDLQFTTLRHPKFE
jgi:hypothetical protein